MFLRLFVTFLLFVLLTEVLIGALMLQRAESHHLSGLLSDFLIAAGLGAVLATVPAFILARRFVQPVHSLTEGAQRIAEGDYDYKIYVSGASEYQALARTFNEMSEELATQFAQLEQDRQQLRAILDGMVEGVVAMDREQCLLFVNDRAADLLGFRPEEAIGRKFWEVVRHRNVQQILQRAHH